MQPKLKMIKPKIAVFFLPILSDIGPNINCPIAIPIKTEVIIQ